MNNRKFILASQSPRRRELLSSLISDFEIIVDNSDEFILPEIPPEDAVVQLALKKAQNVAAVAEGEALVIGADTVVCIDGKILGKPRDEKEAEEMLNRLSGREHYVLTGVAVVDRESKKSVSAAQKTAVRFRELTEREIKSYVKSGEPLDKAGAYGIQGKASVFVEEICGDYFNVVGLPLCTLYKLLSNEFDIELF